MDIFTGVDRLYHRLFIAVAKFDPMDAAHLGIRWQKWFSRHGYKRYPDSTATYLYGGAGRINGAKV